MRLKTYGLHQALTRRASAFIARLKAPDAHVCERCDGVGCTQHDPICTACNGRGWVPNNDPLHLVATAIAFAALLGFWTLLLLAVAP